MPTLTTVDGFLGGALQMRQPKNGYRAATDPVFLAAAVPAKQGQRVLELGCGVGVASLCLGYRVSGLVQYGLELQQRYADLARENAATNGIDLTVHEGNLAHMPADLRNMSFDHVIANPPFFNAGAVTPPKDDGKTIAHVAELALSQWVDAALRRLRPGGMLTLIHLTEQLPETLIALQGRSGNTTVLPITARQGQGAKRVLVQSRKGARGPFQLLAPFVVHAGDHHEQGKADYSVPAQNILRHAMALDWG